MGDNIFSIQRSEKQLWLSCKGERPPIVADSLATAHPEGIVRKSGRKYRFGFIDLTKAAFRWRKNKRSERLPSYIAK